MNEMIKYIFDNLKTTESNVNDICKVVNKQTKCIKKLTLVSLVMATGLVLQNERHKEEQAKAEKKINSLTGAVERLQVEVLALKNTKGEPKM